MRKILFLAITIAALLGSSFGQAAGGTSTPIKTGTAFPNGAPYLSLFGLTTGTPGVYACNHFPTCTSSAQWVGPLGTGGGGGSCSSCADQNLDNLDIGNVAINAALTPTAGTDLVLGYAPGTPQTGGSINMFGATAVNGIGAVAGTINLNGGGGTLNGVPGGSINLTGGPGAGDGAGVFLSGGTGGDAAGASTGNGGDVIGIAGSTSSNGTGNGGNVKWQAGLPNVASGSSSETWNQCNSSIVCNWTLGGGTESITLATFSHYWGWIVPGTSQVTVGGCTTSAMNGTFTVNTAVTGGSGFGGFITITWPNSGSGTCSGTGPSVSGTYSINSGAPGVLEFAGGGALLGSGSAAGGLQLKSGTSGAPGEIDLDTFGVAGLTKIINGNLAIAAGCLSELNGIALKNCGVPGETAEFNAAGTSQTANISGTLIASAGGKYRISASAVVKVAAAGGSPSSTLPAITVSYTDADTGGTVTQQITQTSTANTVGTISSGSVFINPQAASAVTYTTGSTYTSSGSTVMQYVPHVLAEAF